jgi:transcription termination factor Rho
LKAGAFAPFPRTIPTEQHFPSRLDMNLTELKKMPVPELNELAQSMNIEGVARSRKQDLIFAILKAHAKKGEDI